MANFDRLTKFQGSAYNKNLKVIEFREFIQLIISNPEKLLNVKIAPGSKQKCIKECLYMLRYFQEIDKSNLYK